MLFQKKKNKEVKNISKTVNTNWNLVSIFKFTNNQKVIKSNKKESTLIKVEIEKIIKDREITNIKGILNVKL